MDAKKWFTIRTDKDVPYAKVIEVMNALRKAGVVRISLKEGRAGDGKFRVASSTGSYKIDDQRTFSICKLASGPGFFTVHWRAKEGDPVSQWVRISPVEPEGVRGTWAVAWEPGTDVLWWMDAADIGRMNLSDPKQVIVERSARVGARPPGFVPPDGVSELFESLGFFKGLWNRGTVGGDGNLSKRVMEATPAKASGDGKAQPEDAADDVEESPPAPPESPRADVKPDSRHLFNEDYAAIAVQSAKDVNFVLFYKGFLSSGITEWSSGKKWRFEGSLHLVDVWKSQIAGKTVSKRVVAVKYTSDEPTKLYLDGKAYDLARPVGATGKGALELLGRIFILRDEGEPIQTARTLPLRNEKDLVTIGDFAVHDRYMAETYADNRRVLKMEGWSLAWDTQEPVQHGSGELEARMRIFPDGRVLTLNGGRELKEFKITPAELAELTRWLVEDQQVGEWKPQKAKLADTGEEIELSPVKNMWDKETDILIFTRDGKRHGIAVEHGSAGPTFDAIRERLWEVKRKAQIADASAPATGAEATPKPQVEHVSVRIGRDGEIYLDRKKVTLDELKAQAAKDAKKWFTIEADKDVPYAKVIEVVEALKAAGVTALSFAEARVGDGKYRVANLTANYDFDGKHHFSICRPSERPQWFTVGWPAEGERPACALRTFPNVSEQTQGKWAVVWEPGTDVLWWVDDSDVGKMTLTDPARVIVDREGRRNNFSRDFALPDGVVTEFRRLGFEVGRKQVEGERPVIGGNTGGREILSAEPVDAKGSPNKEGAAAPKPDGVQGGPRADVQPVQARQSNDKYSAVAYQTENDVNFVLFYEGFLSTGLSESWSETTKQWRIEGNIHLVDLEKTREEGKNVDNRGEIHLGRTGHVVPRWQSLRPYARCEAGTCFHFA